VLLASASLTVIEIPHRWSLYRLIAQLPRDGQCGRPLADLVRAHAEDERPARLGRRLGFGSTGYWLAVALAESKGSIRRRSPPAPPGLPTLRAAAPHAAFHYGTGTTPAIGGCDQLKVMGLSRLTMMATPSRARSRIYW
jgi:hypothetical protein